jgi:hypothetical protein
MAEAPSPWSSSAFLAQLTLARLQTNEAVWLHREEPGSTALKHIPRDKAVARPRFTNRIDWLTDMITPWERLLQELPQPVHASGHHRGNSAGLDTSFRVAWSGASPGLPRLEAVCGKSGALSGSRDPRGQQI